MGGNFWAEGPAVNRAKGVALESKDTRKTIVSVQGLSIPLELLAHWADEEVSGSFALPGLRPSLSEPMLPGGTPSETGRGKCSSAPAAFGFRLIVWDRWCLNLAGNRKGRRNHGLRSVTPTAELDEAGYAVLAKATRALEESWRAAPNPDSSHLVPRVSDPLRERVLIELIKVDQDLSWASGGRRKLESYLVRWPELKESPEALAELVEAECLTRALADNMPSEAELSSRFPEIVPRIDLRAIQAEVDTERRPRFRQRYASQDDQLHAVASPQRAAAGRGAVLRPLRDSRPC